MFEIDELFTVDLGKLFRKGAKERGDFYRVTIDFPGKPRTTGEGSQSAHFHGHIRQIAFETGNTFDDVKQAIKIRAAEDMKYPCSVILGKTIPQSEADATTEEESILIEMAHLVAAENGIILTEGEEE